MSFLGLSEKAWMWIFIAIALAILIVIVILMIRKEGFSSSSNSSTSKEEIVDQSVPGPSQPVIAQKSQTHAMNAPAMTSPAMNAAKEAQYVGGSGSKGDPRMIEHPPIEIDEGIVDNTQDMVQNLSPSSPKATKGASYDRGNAYDNMRRGKSMYS